MKYKGTIEVPNLSDENTMDDLDVSFTKEAALVVLNWACDVATCGKAGRVIIFQISISLNKDEPDTPLTNLMKTKGAAKIREALGSYVGFLKTGEWQQDIIGQQMNNMPHLKWVKRSGWL